jgi:hypothetical protein
MNQKFYTQLLKIIFIILSMSLTIIPYNNADAIMFNKFKRGFYFEKYDDGNEAKNALLKIHPVGSDIEDLFETLRKAGANCNIYSADKIKEYIFTKDQLLGKQPLPFEVQMYYLRGVVNSLYHAYFNNSNTREKLEVDFATKFGFIIDGKPLWNQFDKVNPELGFAVSAESAEFEERITRQGGIEKLLKEIGEIDGYSPFKVYEGMQKYLRYTQEGKYFPNQSYRIALKKKAASESSDYGYCGYSISGGILSILIPHSYDWATKIVLDKNDLTKIFSIEISKHGNFL